MLCQGKIKALGDVAVNVFETVQYTELMNASTARSLSLDRRYQRPSGEAAGCKPCASHMARQLAASSTDCDPGRLASMISLC